MSARLRGGSARLRNHAAAHAASHFAAHAPAILARMRQPDAAHEIDARFAAQQKKTFLHRIVTQSAFLRPHLSLFTPLLAHTKNVSTIGTIGLSRAGPLPQAGQREVPASLHLASFALCVAHAAYLLAAPFYGAWLIDPSGRPAATDFVNVFAAGQLALAGNPATAYDPVLHRAAEYAAIGDAFPGYYGWLYPPPFLGVAAVLAFFPYVFAYAGWVLATASLYATTLRCIVGSRFGWMLAGAFPAVLCNALVGQNGFLTAALMGSALWLLERRPLLAGCCFGLLTYKPQFGLVVPFALLAARSWSAIFSAGLSAAGLFAASVLAFGLEPWQAFLSWLPRASLALHEQEVDWSKLQTVFGLLRSMGAGESLAWAFQALTTVCALAATVLLWRGPARLELKAAGLVVASVLATPYAYMYDLVLLAIATAFLVRIALETGFARHELIGLAAMAALLASFPFAKAPVGVPATLILAALVAWRCASLGVPRPVLEPGAVSTENTSHTGRLSSAI